jgi:hypothetical protein
MASVLSVPCPFETRLPPGAVRWQMAHGIALCPKEVSGDTSGRRAAALHPNWQCGRTAGSGTDRRLHRTNVAWHAGGPLASPPRFQAELARLVFKVSARTVAKYMQRTDHRGPSPQWRSFLRQHASTVWACDFFCVQTVMFRTLRVFFVIHRSSWQVLHACDGAPDCLAGGTADCRMLWLGLPAGALSRSRRR